MVAGAAAWPVVSLVLGGTPAWLRFTAALGAFTLGSASLIAGALVAELPAIDQAILLGALGVGASPLIADVLGRLGLVSLFPYVAAAGVGLFVVRASATRARADRTSWASLLPIGIALLTGAVVFQHRLLVDGGGITLFGDYDTVDLSYYAGITAELTHRIPPMAPFYAGHPLNYSWYPHLLLALVRRFAGVATLDMYFRYAWPAFLAIGAGAIFVFVRSIASTGVALLATTLLLVGGDFSYVFVWLLRPDTYLFDWLLWPTNFLAPTMEVLHFSTWTPSLPVMFSGLYALARAERGPHAAAWMAIAAASFALLVQFKPFAFAVLIAALVASLVFVRGGPDRRRYAVVLALALAVSLPFLYQIVALYAESRGHLKIDFFLLQRTMLDKLALSGRVHAAVTRIAGDGALHTPLVLLFATVLFFVGGLGVRWAGVRAVARALKPRSEERAIWRFLGWVALAGVAIPFVIVTEPYHDTLQFYQTGLYVLWIFAARSLLAWTRGMQRGAAFGIAAVAIALAVPSSLHYLIEKHGDGPNHLKARLSRSELAVADYLRTTDPEPTVVLHDRPIDPSLIVITGERRAVLAWAPYVTGSAERRLDVDRFFGSADREPQVALDVLRRYGVTHVVVYPNRDRVHAAVLAQLEPVVSFADVVLYQVVQ